MDKYLVIPEINQTTTAQTIGETLDNYEIL